MIERDPKNKKRQRQRKRDAAANAPTELSKDIELVQLEKLEYDKKIFETMSTLCVVDEFFSNKGGIPRACNFILIGDPGVGKTTVALDMICNTIKDGQRALFISAEMNSIDMYEYMERYPKFGQVDILFLGDYTDENPQLVIEKVLEKGYDIVLGDSFAEIQDEVQESCGMSAKGVEKWLIDLMCSHNKGNNEAKTYTTFIMIQQMTKGGKFVGSNKLKHNTTGMLEIKFDGSSEAAPRYAEFTKNRRGNVGKKLYFTLDSQDDVNWLEDKWHMEEENRLKMKDELKSLADEASSFDALLATAPTSDSPDADTVAEEEVEIEEEVQEEITAE